MNTREDFVHADDGTVKKALIVTCPECDNDTFAMFFIEGAGHPHLQCTKCDVSFCSSEGPCSG